MSESETIPIIDDAKGEANPKKRIRHRKKNLYENILKQMEFYFSDANLSKDRFLGDLVKNDPYVPIAEFLKFNKIKSLTQDVNDIVKAMKHSTFLELSEDKTKVKRKLPMMPYDADLRTVYVESIPETASREWLERVFSDFGHVAYISLPKFKNSQRIKGFAFIEFEKPQDAHKCIAAFTEMGCKLPTCMPPEELSSIKLFSVEEPEETNETKEEYEPPKKKTKKAKDKKKHLDLKPDQEGDTEKKSDTPTEENKSIISAEGDKTTDIESKDELTSHDEGKKDDDTPRKKKQKKRSKDKSKSSLVKGEAPKGALWGLQVLPKSEWKSLRNKYLNLQRKYMKEMKTNLYNKRHAYSGIPTVASANDPAEPEENTQEVDKEKDQLQKIPGVFVKEILSEPCIDVRSTKRMIKSNTHALHVEVKEGQSELFIRFDSAEAAEEYTAKSNCARVLSGPEEQEQWQRAIEAQTSARRNRRAHAHAYPPHPASPQPTHTHIRFDE
ncbi:la-related protein 7 [Aricia agestis]|uniref:la-related protein 7 n=1 Tax=Aricia agestis TaxID=91739 RepID=UPI001C2037D8|nr:la-related protein 7 [Aricia agestis]